MIMGILIAYLIGSISAAVLVSRMLGLPDPRSSGSNNPGATNVLRSGSRVGAALTLLGDAAKGWLPVFVALQLGYFPSWMIGLIGLAAFLGHLYPVFFGFKGGKGVATALGVVLAINPLVALMLLITWVAVALILRISSLAGLIAAALAPVYLALLAPDPWLIATLVLMTLILFARHAANIRRILQGAEPRIGAKSPANNP